ncbi:ABC-F type ribosomal protection protein [Anaerobacillus alkalilacustris]|uniref:ABC-F type ribosomal protection protein n=1 Tax=Anaerobacillus alkalilacustris TaxID=393763 RepID=A0A1S2LZ94_9BACI|nr:ABC-F type ribosomal protection protein [Anaerobacillus alkalilacustris]OIJ17666.1 ABC-F type ribosomal protection protein [Anaerobacillus alkalilacustris]
MEQLCLELLKIEISYLDKVVLDIEKLSVYQFDRIGIVGKNGEGKSTLLKALADRVTLNKGKVKRLINVGYFEQMTKPVEIEVDDELLGKLAVPKTEIEKLSGGEQTRMKLAQLFSTYHEGLLIDEPTTHLDAEGIDFLVEELKYYYGALVLVSHDRYVLDQLVTKIWEVQNGKVTEYAGNYTAYVEQKQLERKQHKEQYEKYTKEKNRLLKSAEERMKKAEKVTKANKQTTKKEIKTKGNRMFETKSKDTSQKSMQRAAKAIEQRVKQLDAVDAPKKEKVVQFQQPRALQLHNKFPIIADRITLQVGEKTLLKNASFQFPLGKTIAITGPNGSGKTTLLKHILNGGEGITLSPKIEFGMYEQLNYQFEKSETVLSYMKNKSDYDESKIRAVLHNLNIKGNDLIKDICKLSGGEAIRLVLCQLFLGRYNVLVLDEPTNFLDVDCILALEKFLSAYEGTVLLVSHDRMFVERVADVVYCLEEQQLKLRK